MKTEGQGQRLRVYISESDRWEGRPLYEAIVRAARDAGLAGATVFRGVEGFGAKNRIHTVKVLHLSEDLPIVVEIIDQAARTQPFLSTLEKMVSEGTVTLDDVQMIVFRPDHVETPAAADDDELQLEEPSVGQQSKPSSQFSKLGDAAQEIIAAANQEAAKSHRGFVDSVDLLLALIREPKGIAGRVLADLKVDRKTVETCLREQVSRESPTDQFLAALDKKCLREMEWLDHEHVSTEHLLLALCAIRPSAATDILIRLGAQPRDVCQDVLEILGHGDDWQRWLADHPDM